MKVSEAIKLLQQEHGTDMVSLMPVIYTNKPEDNRVTLIVHREGIVMKDFGEDDMTLNYYFKERT